MSNYPGEEWVPLPFILVLDTRIHLHLLEHKVNRSHDADWIVGIAWRNRLLPNKACLNARLNIKRKPCIKELAAPVRLTFQHVREEVIFFSLIADGKGIFAMLNQLIGK